MKHYNLKITGKVQGVFYRQTTKEKADELGVRGTVQNMNDGSVYAEVEGEDDKVKSLIAWCWTGPSRAEVKDIEITDGDIKGYGDFKVIR